MSAFHVPIQFKMLFLPYRSWRVIKSSKSKTQLYNKVQYFKSCIFVRINKLRKSQYGGHF